MDKHLTRHICTHPIKRL